jgi:hypothetical protein
MCAAFWHHAPLVEDAVPLGVPKWNGEDIFFSLVTYREYGKQVGMGRGRSCARGGASAATWFDAVLFLSKGSLFYDQPNSLLLVIEPVLFINSNNYGRFLVNIREFGRNRLVKEHWQRHVLMYFRDRVAAVAVAVLEELEASSHVE